MTIETTMADLVNAEPALRRVAEQNGMTATTTYRVAKLARLVAQEVKHFHEQRNALFKELGVERDARTPAEREQHGPKVREIPPASFPEFYRRLAEHGAVPVTLDWAPIRSVDLPSAKASDLIDLGPLVELVEPSE